MKAAALALLLALPLLLGSGGFVPADVRVMIQRYDAYCLTWVSVTPTGWTHDTPPTLFVGGQRMGPVVPGTYAWVSGYVRKGVRVELGCPAKDGSFPASLRTAAVWAAKNGCTDALCPVPAAQDFRP